MSKYDHPLLVQDSLPDLIKAGNSKEIDDSLEVGAVLDIAELHSRPGLRKVGVDILVSRLDDLEVGELLEKYLGGGGEPELEVAKQWHRADNGDCFLHVGPSELRVVLLHLLGELNLLEVGDAEQHSLLALEGGLEVEVIEILVLVVG